MFSTHAIVVELKKLSKQKSTGALFVKTDANKLLQLFLVSGVLKSIKYNNLNGIQAAFKVADANFQKWKFYPEFTTKSAPNVESPLELIEILQGNLSYKAYNKNSTRVDKASVSYEEKGAIEDVFTEYMGPMAQLIISEEFKKSNSAEELIDKLAQNLPSQSERNDFVNKIKESINNIK